MFALLINSDTITPNITRRYPITVAVRGLDIQLQSIIISLAAHLWNMLLRKNPSTTRAWPQKKKTTINISAFVCNNDNIITGSRDLTYLSEQSNTDQQGESSYYDHYNDIEEIVKAICDHPIYWSGESY